MAPTTRPERRPWPERWTTSADLQAGDEPAGAGHADPRRRWPTRMSPGSLPRWRRRRRAARRQVDLHPGRPAARVARRRPGHGLGARSRRVRGRSSSGPVQAALERGIGGCPGPIVVAGSLYLVGAVRGILVDDPELRDEPDDAAVVTPAGPEALVAIRRAADRRRRWHRLDPDRARDLPVGRAHVRDGDRQRDPRLVLRRRAGRRRAGREPIDRAVGQAGRMVDEGADLLDVGGESTRPGHAPVDEAEELARVIPVVAAIRAALPDVPISVDTTKPAVAAAALDAGADLLNDVWGVGARRRPGPARRRARRARSSLMHNRAEPRYTDLVRRGRRRPRAGDRAGRRGWASRASR